MIPRWTLNANTWERLYRDRVIWTRILLGILNKFILTVLQEPIQLQLWNSKRLSRLSRREITTRSRTRNEEQNETNADWVHFLDRAVSCFPLVYVPTPPPRSITKLNWFGAFHYGTCIIITPWFWHAKKKKTSQWLSFTKLYFTAPLHSEGVA